MLRFYRKNRKTECLWIRKLKSHQHSMYIASIFWKKELTAGMLKGEAGGAHAPPDFGPTLTVHGKWCIDLFALLSRHVADLATCQDRRANRSMHFFPWTQCGKNVLNFQALLLRIAIQNTITIRFNLIVTWLEMTSLCQWTSELIIKMWLSAARWFINFMKENFVYLDKVEVAF